MAGYPKIWTTIRHEPWFKKLKITQRGLWYELILIAKEQKDDGNVTFKNISDMAAQTGADRRTVSTWLDREIAQGRAAYIQKCKDLIHIFIVHYNDSQELRRYAPKQKSVGTVTESVSNKPGEKTSSYEELKKRYQDD